MHPEAAKAIQEYLQAIPPISLDVPLFRTGKTRRMEYSTFWKLLKAATRACSIPVDRIASHAMRKTFAQKFYEASGKDLFMLSKALGHAQIGTTVKYLQENTDEIHALIKKMK